MSRIDWTALAQQMGTLRSESGAKIENGGTAIGRQAIAEILGADAVRSATDHYVSYAPGHELARSVLLVLRSGVAMTHCLELFRTSEYADTRIAAIELLRHISDRRVLDWLPEIVASTESEVRMWSVSLIDQLLLMQKEIELDEAMPFITLLLQDADAGVRTQAQQLMEMIKEEEL